jgi:hypothetical protein
MSSTRGDVPGSTALRWASVDIEAEQAGVPVDGAGHVVDGMKTCPTQRARHSLRWCGSCDAVDVRVGAGLG